LAASSEKLFMTRSPRRPVSLVAGSRRKVQPFAAVQRLRRYHAPAESKGKPAGEFRDLDHIALSSYFGRLGLRRRRRGETELPPHSFWSLSPGSPAPLGGAFVSLLRSTNEWDRHTRWRANSSHGVGGDRSPTAATFATHPWHVARDGGPDSAKPRAARSGLPSIEAILICYHFCYPIRRHEAKRSSTTARPIMGLRPPCRECPLPRHR